jgi:hypothetical protein
MAKSRVGSQITNLTPNQNDSIYLAVEGMWQTLKNFWQELQLCFKPHFDLRSVRKIMGLQSHGSPN